MVAKGLLSRGHEVLADALQPEREGILVRECPKVDIHRKLW